MEVAKYITYRDYVFCICSSGFFPKSCVKVELLTSKIRAHIKMKNFQNVTGEMLLLCRVLWAGTTCALSM